MNVKPLNGRIITERLPEQTTKGGLILANAEKQDKLVVVSVSDNSPVKVGDIIMIEKYTSTEVRIEDKEYQIVRNENIIAVLS